jgi:hypothetical protein
VQNLNYPLPGRFIFPLAILFWSIGLVPLNAIDRLRLDGVLYVEDYYKAPIELRILKMTQLTQSRDGNGIIDMIRTGQRVKLLGLIPGKYLVNTAITNGRAEGWVTSSDVEPLAEEILKEIQSKALAAEKVKQSIEKGEIEIGMPQEAVTKILGKANSRSTVKEGSVSFEQWMYASFKTAPIYVQGCVNGTNIVSTLYRKVPAGTKVITFQDKKVIRYETKEDDVNIYQNGQTIIPPVFIQ